MEGGDGEILEAAGTGRLLPAVNAIPVETPHLYDIERYL